MLYYQLEHLQQFSEVFTMHIGVKNLVDSSPDGITATDVRQKFQSATEAQIRGAMSFLGDNPDYYYIDEGKVRRWFHVDYGPKAEQKKFIFITDYLKLSQFSGVSLEELTQKLGIAGNQELIDKLKQILSIRCFFGHTALFNNRFYNPDFAPKEGETMTVQEELRKDVMDAIDILNEEGHKANSENILPLVQSNEYLQTTDSPKRSISGVIRGAVINGELLGNKHSGYYLPKYADRFEDGYSKYSREEDNMKHNKLSAQSLEIVDVVRKHGNLGIHKDKLVSVFNLDNRRSVAQLVRYKYIYVTENDICFAPEFGPNADFSIAETELINLIKGLGQQVSGYENLADALQIHPENHLAHRTLQAWLIELDAMGKIYQDSGNWRVGQPEPQNLKKKTHRTGEYESLVVAGFDSVNLDFYLCSPGWIERPHPPLVNRHSAFTLNISMYESLDGVKAIGIPQSNGGTMIFPLEKFNLGFTRAPSVEEENSPEFDIMSLRPYGFREKAFYYSNRTPFALYRVSKGKELTGELRLRDDQLLWIETL